MEFKYKDVISLDETLSPIILAGLTKFKEELVKSKYGSYPAEMFDLIGVEGFNPTDEEDEACWNKWLGILDRMIYAFNPEEEPNTEEYEFEFVWQDVQETGQVSIDVSDKVEYNRYREDEEEWIEKCREGRMLFSQFYENLWI